MTLLDSSAWIEFLRRTGSETDLAVDRALGHRPRTCPPVRMELLAGARSDQEVAAVTSALAYTELLTCGDSLFDVAAGLYRACRTGGDTPRNKGDCLIAAIAIVHDEVLLHNDRDFDVLARHTPLRATRG